jgi:hypothetical protein
MRQRVRWRALLTLPLATPAGSRAGRSHALRLMARGDAGGDVMDRYGAMKALALLAAPGDAATIGALAHALRDWVDVMKLQAGEHLVALAARGGELGLSAALEALIAELRHDNAYTRFAAAVALRKLAHAACGARAPRVAGELGAALLGQLHAPPARLERISQAARDLFFECAAAAPTRETNAAEGHMEPRASAVVQPLGTATTTTTTQLQQPQLPTDPGGAFGDHAVGVPRGQRGRAAGARDRARRAPPRGPRLSVAGRVRHPVRLRLARRRRDARLQAVGPAAQGGA